MCSTGGLASMLRDPCHIIRSSGLTGGTAQTGAEVTSEFQISKSEHLIICTTVVFSRCNIFHVYMSV